MIIDPKKIIITRNEKGVNLRKVGAAINFLFFWGFSIYLVRTVITMIGWVISYFVFGKAIADTGLKNILVTCVTMYLPLILLASLALWTWAAYNRYRYGGNRDKRRVQPPALTPEEVSDYTGLPLAKVEDTQAAKVVVCHFDDTGLLIDADCYADASTDVAEVDCSVVEEGESVEYSPPISARIVTRRIGERPTRVLSGV